MATTTASRKLSKLVSFFSSGRLSGERRRSVTSTDSSANSDNVSTSDTISNQSNTSIAMASYTSLDLYRCNSNSSSSVDITASSASAHNISHAGKIMRFSSKSNTAVYEGEFGSHGTFHGYGVLVAGDFAYAGEWQSSRPHGHGVYMCVRTGAKYEGEFKNGVAHGHGRIVQYSADGEHAAYAYGLFTNGSYSHKRSKGRDARAQSVSSMSQGRKVAAVALSTATQKLQRRFTTMAKALATSSSSSNDNNNNLSNSHLGAVRKSSNDSLTVPSVSFGKSASSTLPIVAPGAVTALIQVMH